MRCPKNAAGLRCSLRFSTAAETAPRLFLPPAAAGRCSPSFIVSIGGVKRIAALRCQWQSKQSRNFRSRTALRLEPSRRGAQTVFAARRSGRNRNLPPLVSFSFPLSLGQARERGSFLPCTGKEKMDTRQVVKTQKADGGRGLQINRRKAFSLSVCLRLCLGCRASCAVGF